MGSLGSGRLFMFLRHPCQVRLHAGHGLPRQHGQRLRPHAAAGRRRWSRGGSAGSGTLGGLALVEEGTQILPAEAGTVAMVRLTVSGFAIPLRLSTVPQSTPALRSTGAWNAFEALDLLISQVPAGAWLWVRCLWRHGF